MLGCTSIAKFEPSLSLPETVGFFDIFTRRESANVTIEILRLLGHPSVDLSAAHAKHGLYEIYKGLPELDLHTSSLDLIQCHALFSKNGDMLSPINKENVAYETFKKFEESCRVLNERYASRTFSWLEASVLHTASRYISDVLGRCPQLADLDFAFGPGASVNDVTSKGTSPQWKLAGAITLSNSLLPLREQVRALFPAWLNDKNIIPVCGKLEFVPKSHKTHRSIMVEPVLNALLQKGVGSYLKRRLYARGIDLTDQSVQRERARVGSLTDQYSTIDLSGASDSIAWSLVQELLPSDWFSLLDSLRTSLCRYKRETFILEKFSSMGNGFTFELETLIFKALCVGIAAYHGVEDDSICYGDDITCHPDLADLIVEHFPTFGFTVNVEKSFVRGSFKEACGGDYRDGVDIRPFFLRSLRDGGRWSYQKIFSYHNFLQRKPWFDRTGNIRRYLLSLIPSRITLWGPDGYGDGHLVSFADPKTYLKPSHASKRYYEGYRFKTWVARPYRAAPPADTRNLPSYVAYAGLSREGKYEADVIRAPKGARIRARKATVTLV